MTKSISAPMNMNGQVIAFANKAALKGKEDMIVAALNFGSNAKIDGEWLECIENYFGSNVSINADQYSFIVNAGDYATINGGSEILNHGSHSLINVRSRLGYQRGRGQ